VLAALAAHGAATLSSDDVVHGLYARPDVIDAVVQRFGGDVLRPDGSVDRAVLGARAFGREGGIRALEELLFPLVHGAREAWVAAARAARPRPPVLVCEVPLLFEAGLADRFDAVLVVTAPEEVRRARVEARGQAFAERAGRQWDEARKVAAADRVLVNDGDLAAVDRWAASVVADYGVGG
jgi:dephospho-CoA kinase